MCWPFFHGDRVVDMIPGRKTHRSFDTGELFTIEITAVLYQCTRCGRLKSENLVGRFRLERVQVAQESRELSRLVKIEK